MYSFKDYLKLEILKDTNNIYLSFLKNIFRLGNLNAMILIRSYQLIGRKKSIFSTLLCRIIKNRLIKIYGIEINKGVEIGLGFHLGHANGIIFGENVKIGKNVTIYHQVTFGISNIKYKGDKNAYPMIEDNCIFYAGSKVFGKIIVKKGTVLGANAVLTTDTEENSIYGGIPAKKIN